MIAAVLTFAALFALDFVWVVYTRAITENAPARAGGFAVAIILLSGTAAINYTSNPWMLIPAGLGAFAGTYGAMRWKKHA